MNLQQKLERAKQIIESLKRSVVQRLSDLQDDLEAQMAELDRVLSIPDEPSTKPMTPSADRAALLMQAESDVFTLAWPLKIETHAINSPFGHRRPTFDHEGVDLFAPMNTPVLAAATGRVVRVNTGGAYGSYIRIESKRSDGKYLVWYCHLARQDVREGQIVLVGEQIGLSDNTGNSTGPHLHLTVQKDGNKTAIRGVALLGCLDPERYGMEGWPAHG